MVNVPASYVPLLNEMSAGTGIPYAVEAAQANEESGFNATAVSSAGAEGWLQFLPSTYDEYAQQAGQSPGTEFNPGDEAQVYIVFMNALLKTEGGNVYKALEAYNAGFEPGSTTPNPAGASYAQAILSAAGESTSTTASGGKSPAPSIVNDLNSALGGIVNLGAGSAGSSVVNDLFGGIINYLLQAFGLGSIKDLLIRGGLIILGSVILLIAITEFMKAPAVEIVKDTVAK